MTAVLAVSLIFFCTCCAGASMSSSRVEKPDEQTVEDIKNTKQIETIRKVMEEQGYSETQTENILITVTDTLPEIVITRIEPIEDEIGKGVMITGKKKERYNVYINKKGNVLGIKELKTDEYIFSTYE